jgi:hypothetical protein
MRKHYYFRPSNQGWDAWDVDHLVSLSRALPVADVPLEQLTEIDTPHWFAEDGSPMTVRSLVWHCRTINTVDLSYPVILSPEGSVMDGMHRVARALLEDRKTIAGRRFAEMPDPDYRNCLPSELPWDESAGVSAENAT